MGLFDVLRKKDLYVGICVLLFAYFIYISTYTFPVAEIGFAGPRSFPRFVAGCLSILGLIVLVSALIDKESDVFSLDRHNLARLLKVFLAIVIVITLLLGTKQIAFFPFAVLCTTLLMKLASRSRWTARSYIFAIAYSSLLAQLIYYVFVKILKVAL